MDDVESLWYQKRLAIEGIRSSILTALGIGLFATGMTLSLTEIHLTFVWWVGIVSIFFGCLTVCVGAIWSKSQIMDMKYTPITVQRECSAWKIHFSRSWYCQMYV